MTKFTQALYSTSASALGVALLMTAASPAFAQAGPPAPKTAPPAAAQGDDSATIVVTGFRAALQSAVNKKKKADQIVESVSAEDIGKLPDASIGEAIARLPGLTSQRLSGRADVISIRGFGPDYSSTLLNGREQTSTGDNRAVQFDQYPAEIVSQVNVYKTPMASIVGQGIAGTVDLRTIRPLEYAKRILSVGGRIVYPDQVRLNPEAKKYGYRANGVFVDQFADGKVGVAVAASYNNEPYGIEEFNAWGYADGPAGSKVIGGLKPYATSTNLKRLGLTGTLEFKPTDNITSTIDALYSNFKDDQIKRGIEIPLQWGGATLQPGYTVTNGVVTAGTFTGINNVVRNVVQPRHSKLYSYGWNNRYDGENGVHASLDLSYSKTNRTELVFETYAGTGYNGSGPTDSFSFITDGTGTHFTNHNTNYADPNQIVVTDPRGWGGTDPLNGAIRPGYYNNRIVHDLIKQVHPEVSKDLTGGFLSKIIVGGNYTDHKKSLTPDESYVEFADPLLRNLVLPAQYRLGSANLGYLGLGGSLAYDPNALLAGGIYKLVSNNANLDVRAKAYDVHEKLGTLYVQANIKSHLGAADLTGNIGIQAEHTDQSTNGYLAFGGAIKPVTQGAKYWDIMPSLNLSARFTSDWVVRLGLAREVMRPRMDSMRLGFSYGLSKLIVGGVNKSYLSGGSGNPLLRPFRADAADLSIEKYFGTKGYISAQLFYKHFNTFVVEQNIPGTGFDYTGFPLPSNVQTTDPTLPDTYLPASGITNGLIFQPYNTKGGSMYGIELGATLPIGDFIHALDGFGITGGLSYTKSKVNIFPGGKSSDLPGYSKIVANGTAYFEKGGFSIRGSIRHRSSFQGEVSGFAANRTFRRGAPETIVDAQIGYDFKGTALNGLSVYLQGQNLTDEPFATNDGSLNPLRVIDYQKYGSRFQVGATFKL